MMEIQYIISEPVRDAVPHFLDQIAMKAEEIIETLGLASVANLVFDGTPPDELLRD